VRAEHLRAAQAEEEVWYVNTLARSAVSREITAGDMFGASLPKRAAAEIGEVAAASDDVADPDIAV
jgi:hypothetical protein